MSPFLSKAPSQSRFGESAHHGPSALRRIDSVLKQTKLDFSTGRGFVPPLPKTHPTSSHLGPTLPSDQGLTRILNREREELEMAFFLAFLDPSLRGPHETDVPGDARFPD